MKYQVIQLLSETVLLCVLISFLITPALASVYGANGTEIQSDYLFNDIRDDESLLFGILNPGEIIFFTNSHCGACHETNQYVKSFDSDHPEFLIRTYDIFNSPDNRTIFETYKEKYHQKYLSTPSIMIGNLTLEGSQDIQRYLERIVSLQQNKTESTGLFSSNARNFVSSSQGIPLILIFGAGLVDGINPCAFAVLVLMLISLMKQKTRNAMFIAGITYITAVFIFYLLSGIGIFSVIQTAGVTNAFSFIAGCITCIAGILMLRDALKPGDRSLLGISPSHMGVIQQLMKIATLPSAFILGILVGIFELPCTGGIYLSILSMISLKSNFSQAFGYLILYNLAFIIPLVSILVLVAFGLPPERVNTWRLEQRQSLKGIIGVVLIGFALYIFTLNMGYFFIW